MKDHKQTLNLGCGPDEWGDVRVDKAFKTQTGVPSRANVIADAHYLPFRADSFNDCRCFHLIEHCKKPADVVSEIRRVSDNCTLRFPMGDITRNTIINFLNLDMGGLKHDFLTKRYHAHLWSIQPNSRIAVRRSREIFAFLHSGRKARLFSRFRPRMSWEWEVKISSRKG